PVDLHPKSGVPGGALFLTRMYSSGKFAHKMYGVSGALHGVRLSVLNGLRGSRGGRRCLSRTAPAIRCERTRRASPPRRGGSAWGDSHPNSFENESDGSLVEVAMHYHDGYNESIFTFVNNIDTIEGGTHLVGFKAGLARAFIKYAKDNKYVKSGEGLEGDDVREGLTAILSLKIPEPQFEGQTKMKLGNSEVKGIVESIVYEKLTDF